MEYVRLGNTGMKGSRICLGTMTYGSSDWRDWVLDEAESKPFYRRAIERTGSKRGSHRPRSGGVRTSRRGGHYHQSVPSHGRRPERTRAVAKAYP